MIIKKANINFSLLRNSFINKEKDETWKKIFNEKGYPFFLITIKYNEIRKEVIIYYKLNIEKINDVSEVTALYNF